MGRRGSVDGAGQNRSSAELAGRHTAASTPLPSARTGSWSLDATADGKTRAVWRRGARDARSRRSSSRARCSPLRSALTAERSSPRATMPTLRVWDAATGRQIALPDRGHLELHPHDAAFSADGKIVTSATTARRGSGMRTAGRRSLIRAGAGGLVTRRLPSARTASGSSQPATHGFARIWDAAERRTLFPLKAHEDRSTAPASARDGALVTPGARRRDGEVWDASDEDTIRSDGSRIRLVLRGHTQRSRPSRSARTEDSS